MPSSARLVEGLQRGVFPVPTAADFFRQAARVVDLGGEPANPWTWRLARLQRSTRLELVNIRGQESEAERVRRAVGLPNLRCWTYDFLAPPAVHPAGSRVVMNSPSFGGLADPLVVARFVGSVDSHLVPGGVFYAHADLLWLFSMDELARLCRPCDDLTVPISPFGASLEERLARVLDALRGRFGQRNVSEAPLLGYDDERHLNAWPQFTVQIRKDA